MAMSNIHGVIGKSFQIGLDIENSVTLNFDIDGDKALHFNRPIDLDDNPIKSDYIPKRDEDLINLFYMNQTREELYQSVIDYVDVKVREIIGNEEEPGSPGNLMLNPLTVTPNTLVDGMNYSLGTLKKGKFIQEIVVELVQMFHLLNDMRYEIAIGTKEDPEKYVKWFEITGKEDTLIVQIYKTLEDDEEFIVYCREKDPTIVDPPEPENPFVQKLYNTHKSVVDGQFNFDASGKVCNISLSSTYVGTEDITDRTKFPYPNQHLLDFGINLPTVKGHEYQILEFNNPALSHMAHLAGVNEQDGVYSRRTTFTATGNEVDYYFLLGRAQHEDEFIHIILYDLDGEDPEMGEKAYHIENAIRISQEVSPVPTDKDYVWVEPGGNEDHEYSQVVKASGTDTATIDAGDDVNVSITQIPEDVPVDKTLYYDKSVDITYIKLHTMDALTGISEESQKLFVGDAGTDAIDMKLNMKLMPVDSPFYVKETNKALAKFTSVNGSIPTQDADTGEWSVTTLMRVSDMPAVTPNAVSVPYTFVLDYPENKETGDTSFIALYSDAELQYLQRLYVIQNKLGIEDKVVTPIAELKPATYTRLGGVIIKEHSGLRVDKNGVLSIDLANASDLGIGTESNP